MVQELGLHKGLWRDSILSHWTGIRIYAVESCKDQHTMQVWPKWNMRYQITWDGRSDELNESRIMKFELRWVKMPLLELSGI